MRLDEAPAQPPPDRRWRLRRAIEEWYPGLSPQRRRAVWAAFAIWVVIGLVAFGLPALIGDWTSQLRGQRVRVPPEAMYVLVVVDDGSEPPALALLHADGSGAGVVLLPATTIVEVPGAGAPQSLAATLRTSGEDVVAIATANVLGTRVPHVAVADPGRMGGLVEALGGVTVRVPESIDVDDEGVTRRLFTRGTVRMDGDDLVRFLTLAVPGQTELERVARQHAAWRAVADRLGDADPGAAGVVRGWAGDGAPILGELLVRMGSHGERVMMSTLPVRRAGVVQEDLYTPDRAQLSTVRGQLGALSRVPEDGPRRVRLLVGTDAPAGPPVARILIDAGYTIVLAGRAEEPSDRTSVVMAEQTGDLREMADDIARRLGVGTVAAYRTPQTLFDVTLVVGRDWAVANGLEAPDTPQPTPGGRG